MIAKIRRTIRSILPVSLLTVGVCSIAIVTKTIVSPPSLLPTTPTVWRTPCPLKVGDVLPRNVTDVHGASIPFDRQSVVLVLSCGSCSLKRVLLKDLESSCDLPVIVAIAARRSELPAELLYPSEQVRVVADLDGRWLGAPVHNAAPQAFVLGPGGVVVRVAKPDEGIDELLREVQS